MSKLSEKESNKNTNKTFYEGNIVDDQNEKETTHLIKKWGTDSAFSYWLNIEYFNC